MPLSQEDALKLVKRRHPEWLEFQKTWRWLQDSLEAGERYKQANYYYDPTLPQMPEATWPTYGYDPPTGERIPIAYGQIVQRNLIPHLSEMADDGKDLYVMRLARTPVPRLVQRSITAHLSRIYGHEVKRQAPTLLEDWWKDVDGNGTPMDKWFRKTIAPLFLVCGHLDLVFDHPKAPEGSVIESQADAEEADLDAVLGGYILPENMLWWVKDCRGHYTECLVFERSDGGIHYRHYTPEEICLYKVDGDPTSNGGPGNVNITVVETRPNQFGFVPIVRLFDCRKPRCSNTGQSRYEGTAELQKAIYNTRSEIIVNDVFHSHPLLQGPAEYCQSDGKIPIGPAGVLPMKNTGSSTGTPYQAWSYVDPPQNCATELRTHIQDMVDESDRYAALAKPAGHSGKSITGQSGIAKLVDEQAGDDYLSEVAETLADCERAVALMVLSVQAGILLDDDDMDDCTITYPKDYNLRTAKDLIDTLVEIQGVATAAGDLPEIEEEFLQRIITTMLPGLDDDRLDELYAELKAFLAKKVEEAAQYAEAREAVALVGTNQPVQSEAGVANDPNTPGGPPVGKLPPPAQNVPPTPPTAR